MPAEDSGRAMSPDRPGRPARIRPGNDCNGVVGSSDRRSGNLAECRLFDLLSPPTQRDVCWLLRVAPWGALPVYRDLHPANPYNSITDNCGAIHIMSAVVGGVLFRATADAGKVAKVILVFGLIAFVAHNPIKMGAAGQLHYVCDLEGDIAVFRDGAD